MLGNAAKYIQMLFRNALAFWALVGLATRSLLTSLLSAELCLRAGCCVVTPKNCAGPTSLRVVLGQCQDCEMCITAGTAFQALNAPNFQ
jgi:hypothetical protein